MPTPQFPSISNNATIEELRDSIIGMNRYLTYLLSALDTLNVSRLDAKVIIAQSITADKMNVSELSAISANLGHITAGLIEAVTIIGSLIQTATSGQRIELSSSDNLLKAVNSSGYTLRIDPNAGTSPGLVLSVGGPFGAIQFFGSDLLINTVAANIQISAGGDVVITSTGAIKMYGNDGLYYNDDLIHA